MMYALDFTVNYPDGSEVDASVPLDMNLGALEDMVSDIVQNEPQASSFVFCVVQKVV